MGVEFSWQELSQNFHFLRPFWLALIPLALLAYFLLRQTRNSTAAWEALCDPRLLQWLTRGQQQRPANRWPWHLLLIAWLLGLLALAGPSWERQQHESFVKQWPRVFVVDLSAAMLAPDLAPTRLQRARFKLADFLARTTDEQVALVNFSGAAFIAAPLTQDANTVSALLEALHPNIMPVGGHDAAVGLREAGDLIHQAGMSQGEIILLTDHVSGQAMRVADELAEQGVRTSVLGIGSEAGAPIPRQQGFVTNEDGSLFLSKLDESSLQQLAQAGGGRYARITADDRDVDWLLAADAWSEGAYTRAQERQNLEIWLERGPWLILLLLPLGLFGFRRGWLWVLLPVLLLPMPKAEAGWWQDLWQRGDQQARQYLDQGAPEQALGLSDNPLLQGEAAFRNGEFDQAAQQFAQQESAQAHYNRGNALAKAGELPAAIAAYDDALVRDPDFADAQFNKALVEELLKQQQNQEQKQQQQDQQGQDQQQEQQDQQDQESQQDEGEKSEDQQGQQSQEDTEQSQDSEQQEQENPQDSQQQSDEEEQQKQQDAEQQEQESDAEQEREEQQRQAQEQQQEAAEAQEQQAQPEEQSLTEEERQQLQAMEQWLRRVPDDPGGLLRAKFQLEYLRERQQKGKQ